MTQPTPPQGSGSLREILGALSTGELATEQAVQQVQALPLAPMTRTDPAPQTFEHLIGAPELEDPPTAIEGSFDEIKMAFMRGQITKEQYAAFYEAHVGSSKK